MGQISPCATQRAPFNSLCQAPLQLGPNSMRGCKAGCFFGCWQLTGCRGTLPFRILPFWVQMQCCGVREPPAESAESPEAPSVDGVTEPLSPLEASVALQRRILSFIFVVAQARDAIALLSLYWDAIPV